MIPIIEVQDIYRNGKIYNGTTRKFGVTINGIDYIIKFAKDNGMSVYCEYVASNFIRSLGISCHEVFLGNYGGSLVNVIRDFTSGTNLVLHSYKDTKQSSEDTLIEGKEYTYDDVLYLIDKHLKMSDANKCASKHHFWDMFICDAIIGNRDRHWGNWGYLRSVGSELGYVFAPLYDNGGGLFQGVYSVIDQYINSYTREQFLRDRIYTFPASLFKFRRNDRSYRSNYYEMFADLRVNKVFAEQVRNFKSKFSYEAIFDLALKACDELPLEVYYRRFYIEIITLRYMCIVLRMDFDKAYRIVERGLTKYA